MDEKEYLKELTTLENELTKLQSQFANLNPEGQENARIGTLLEHLRNLKKLLEIGFYEKISNDIKQSDLDYFRRNVDGLNLVLEAKRGHKNGSP